MTEGAPLMTDDVKAAMSNADYGDWIISQLPEEN